MPRTNDGRAETSVGRRDHRQGKEEFRDIYFSMLCVTPSFGFFEELSRVGFLFDQLNERQFDRVFSELVDGVRVCRCHRRPMQ